MNIQNRKRIFLVISDVSTVTMSLFPSTGAEWRVLIIMDVKVIKFYYVMIKFLT